MKKLLSISMIAVFVLLASCGTGKSTSQSTPVGPADTGASKVKLSASCDYILSMGTDSSGIVYELVANQKEDAKGSLLQMGIIADNAWVTPMSADFPFIKLAGIGDLSDKGRLNELRKKIWFIDSGAFLYEFTADASSIWHYNSGIIFSCKNQQTYAIDRLDFIQTGNKISDSFIKNDIEGDVSSWRKIHSYDGTLTIVDTNRNGSTYISDHTYDIYILNTSTLEKNYIMKDSKNSPSGPYCEGMIVLSDNKFYDKNGQVVIDLNSLGYKIKSTGGHFSNGKYSFTVANDLGNDYTVVIDNSGKVLSETKKQ